MERERERERVRKRDPICNTPITTELTSDRNISFDISQYLQDCKEQDSGHRNWVQQKDEYR